jgi:hypothetical protein
LEGGYADGGVFVVWRCTGGSAEAYARSLDAVRENTGEECVCGAIDPTGMVYRWAYSPLDEKMWIAGELASFGEDLG